MKRTLSLVLALVMVLGTFTMAFADHVGDAQVEAGKLLESLGVLEGDGEGNLYLETGLKRQDAVIMLSRLMGEEEIAKNFPVDEDATYPDVNDSFYFGYLAWAQANGTFEGNAEGKFLFNEILTAQSYAKVLLTALGYEVGSLKDVEWDDALAKAKELGIVTETENGLVSRGMMASMTVNALSVKVKDGSMTLGEKIGVVVTPEAPTEIKVEKVTATNYKQVMVEFNTKVDEKSATNLDNYTISSKSFEEAIVMEDGKTVVLTLKDDGTTTLFEAQKEYELTINNVEDLAMNVKLTKVTEKFKAVDTTIPTVKEVVGLGTKAIKVVFSEPVKETTANSTLRYKIDDKTISGYVKYVYPNEVIISTTVSVGDHELSVKDVEDYAGYKVQETGYAFTIVEDKDAPEIVSAKTTDLDVVEVEFNEPVKSITSASHTSKGSGAKSIEIKGNKATITFTNKMSLSDTTIYVNGVTDYSDNKADRSIVVTPELDLSRPEVVTIKVSQETSGTKFKIEFNKKVVAKSENFIIKKADGTLLTANGIYKGEPIVPLTPLASDTNRTKTVEFTTAGNLKTGNYTLEISGVRDTATVANVMLPYTHTLTIGDTTAPSISKAWKEAKSGGGYNVYVQFDEDMSVEGIGSVLEVVKYSYSVGTSVYNPMPVDTTVELITPNTVKLDLAKKNNTNIDPQGIEVKLVTDLAGNWIGGNDVLVATKAINSQAQSEVMILEANAISKDTLEVKFDSKLSNINSSDFEVTGDVYSGLYLDKYEYDGNKTIATFKLSGGNKFTNKQGIGMLEVTNPKSTDEFGNKLSTLDKSITDKIRPTVVVPGAEVAANVITIAFDEILKTSSDVNAAVFTVEVNGEEQEIFKIEAGSKIVKITLVDTPDTSNTAITVTLNESTNDAIKALTDVQGNTPKAFTEVIVNGNQSMSN